MLRATWKDGPDGLLERPLGRGTVSRTGRCEPRSPVPGLEARGEQWGEPVATTPRAAGNPPSRPLRGRSLSWVNPWFPHEPPPFGTVQELVALNLPAAPSVGGCPFGVVCLPPGSARLRRRIALALGAFDLQVVP